MKKSLFVVLLFLGCEIKEEPDISSKVDEMSDFTSSTVKELKSCQDEWKQCLATLKDLSDSTGKLTATLDDYLKKRSEILGCPKCECPKCESDPQNDESFQRVIRCPNFHKFYDNCLDWEANVEMMCDEDLEALVPASETCVGGTKKYWEMMQVD